MSEFDALARKVVSLMDLTALNDTDTDTSVVELCQRASSPVGQTAAVCVWPQFVHIAKYALAQADAAAIKVATVVNFPHGNSDIAQAVAETQAAIAAGAAEVDLVYPYRQAIQGNLDIGRDMVGAVKAECGTKVRLKVILETGELPTDLIAQLSQQVIAEGADFIKTSTGKVPVNATLEAARIMLEAIRRSGGSCGFKAAGGIRTLEQADAYLELAEQICGRSWVVSSHFRFGASGLLDDVLRHCGDSNIHSIPSGY
ncbi:deoxyribose-phosphate aldolase [Neiella sp. HB171785]|uniref:Deoxyribose-phosphate aldolase n=1 Tax=Neiella litorisoli TaxID=2771431 RepID=A0A8J6QJN4_9GAMM|nr:deoxyribose-phosphate aldolase [Neiella litorisoli]MBD1390383.1 deoxyribose-phosphate aldolase [Neiella litorisoli]